MDLCHSGADPELGNTASWPVSFGIFSLVLGPSTKLKIKTREIIREKFYLQTCLSLGTEFLNKIKGELRSAAHKYGV